MPYECTFARTVAIVAAVWWLAVALDGAFWALLLAKGGETFFLTLHQVAIGFMLFAVGLLGIYCEIHFSVRHLESWTCPEFIQIAFLLAYLLIGGVVGAPDGGEVHSQDADTTKENLAKFFGIVLCVMSWCLGAARLVIMVRLRYLFDRHREAAAARDSTAATATPSASFSAAEARAPLTSSWNSTAIAGNSAPDNFKPEGGWNAAAQSAGPENPWALEGAAASAAPTVESRGSLNAAVPMWNPSAN